MPRRHPALAVDAAGGPALFRLRLADSVWLMFKRFAFRIFYYQSFLYSLTSYVHSDAIVSFTFYLCFFIRMVGTAGVANALLIYSWTYPLRQACLSGSNQTSYSVRIQVLFANRSCMAFLVYGIDDDDFFGLATSDLKAPNLVYVADRLVCRSRNLPLSN